MTDELTSPAMRKVKKYTGGAVGAGLVLVVLPCVALYCGIDRMNVMPAIGLPILAIFGIMILFGALALISTLFARLDLSDPSQALALPEGSIRAAIALALIVLFAIIAIMLYQSTPKPYVITGLGDAEKQAMVRDTVNRVIAVVPERCANAPPVAWAVAPAERAAGGVPEKCAPENLRYSVHVIHPPSQDSTDLAKQLLILIGTLMTSVTSFYFASRATEPKRRDEPPPPALSNDATPSSDSPSPATTAHAEEGHVDGCDIPIVDATADEDLPASKGGVA